MAWTNVGSLKGPKGDNGDKGTVTPATAIADLTAAPTAGDFNALLNALRAAGLMDRPTTPESPNLYVAPSLPQTIRGITFSDAGNGGIHCKGTGNGYAILLSDTLTLQAGTYSVSTNNEDVYMELARGSITILNKNNPVKSIPTGDYTPKLVVVTGKPIDETVYPRLVRIDQ